MADLGTMMATLGIDTSGVDRASGRMRSFESEISSSADRMVSTLKRVSVAVGAIYAVNAIKNHIKEVTHLAGTYEQLGIVMNISGKNAGYSASQMAKFEEGLKKTGIASVEARRTLSSLATAGIDLAKSQQMARAAQDLAVVASINSSDAFERMTHAIKSNSVEVLQTMGMNVSFEQGYKNLAVQLGKNANQLTQTEKTQARVNLVLQEAAKYQGIYEGAMGSAEKQMGSLQRHIDEYRLTLGKAFQPAYLEYARAQTEIFKEMKETVSDIKFQSSLEFFSSTLMKITSSSITSGIKLIHSNIRDLTDFMISAFQLIITSAGKVAEAILGINTAFNWVQQTKHSSEVMRLSVEMESLAGTIKAVETDTMSWGQTMKMTIAHGTKSEYLKSLKTDLEQVKEALQEKILVLNKDNDAMSRNKNLYEKLHGDLDKINSKLSEFGKWDLIPVYELPPALEDVSRTAKKAGEDLTGLGEDAEKTAKKIASLIKTIQDETSNAKAAFEDLGKSDYDKAMAQIARQYEAFKQSVGNRVELEKWRVAQVELADKEQLARSLSDLQSAMDAETTVIEQSSQNQFDAKEAVWRRFDNVYKSFIIGEKEFAKQAYMSDLDVYLKVEQQKTGITDEEIKKRKDFIMSFYDSEEVVKTIEAIDKALEKINDEPLFESSIFGDDADEELQNFMGSFEKLFKMYDKIADREKEIIELRAKANDIDNIEKRGEALKKVSMLEQAYAEESATSQLAGYRQLFGTASQLFEENTQARKTMHDAEMIFAAAEIAINIKKALVEAVAATAAQGSIPIAGFAMVAAMAVMMGVLLSQIGQSFTGVGGAAPNVSNLPDSTVLGAEDGTASESIQNSYDMLEKAHAQEYAALIDIYNEVKQLNQNITGLVTEIIKGVGGDFTKVDTGNETWIGGAEEFWNSMTEGMQDLLTLDPLLGWITGFVGDLIGDLVSSIFGGGGWTDVQRVGIIFGQVSQSFADILAGGELLAKIFADIHKHEEGGWFSDDEETFWTEYKDLDQDVIRLLTKVFKSIGESFVTLAEGLGVDVQAVYDYIIPLTKLDLRDMNAEQINEAITAFFANLTDQMAEDLFGDILKQYQKVGEGLYETAVRIVVEKEIFLTALEMTGQAFVGTAQEAIALSQAVIALAGDIDTLMEDAEAYYSAFFSESEQQAFTLGYLTQVLADLGLTFPSTKDGFRDLIEGLDLSTEEGQKLYVALLAIAGAAGEYYDLLEDNTQTIVDAQRKLSGTETEGALQDIADRYGIQVENITQTWAQSIIDAFTSMSTNEVIMWAEALGVSTDQLVSDIMALADAFDVVTQSFEEWKAALLGLEDELAISTIAEKYGLDQSKMTKDWWQSVLDWIYTMSEEQFAAWAASLGVSSDQLRADINALDAAFAAAGDSAVTAAARMNDLADEIRSVLDEVRGTISGDSGLNMADEILARFDAMSKTLYDTATGEGLEFAMQDVLTMAQLAAEWYDAAIKEAEEDARKVAELERDRIEGLIADQEAQRDILQEELQVAQAFGSLADSIYEIIKSIKYSSMNINLPHEKAEESKVDYYILKEKAETSGLAEDYQTFVDFAQTYLQQSQAAYKSSQKYQDIYAEVMTDLEEVMQYAGNQNNEEDIVAQLKTIDATIQSFRDDINNISVTISQEDLDKINATFNDMAAWIEAAMHAIQDLQKILDDDWGTYEGDAATQIYNMVQTGQITMEQLAELIHKQGSDAVGKYQAGDVAGAQATLGVIEKLASMFGVYSAENVGWFVGAETSSGTTQEEIDQDARNLANIYMAQWEEIMKHTTWANESDKPFGTATSSNVKIVGWDDAVHPDVYVNPVEGFGAWFSRIEELLLNGTLSVTISDSVSTDLDTMDFWTANLALLTWIGHNMAEVAKMMHSGTYFTWADFGAFAPGIYDWAKEFNGGLGGTTSNDEAESEYQSVYVNPVASFGAWFSRIEEHLLHGTLNVKITNTSDIGAGNFPSGVEIDSTTKALKVYIAGADAKTHLCDTVTTSVQNMLGVTTGGASIKSMLGYSDDGNTVIGGIGKVFTGGDYPGQGLLGIYGNTTATIYSDLTQHNETRTAAQAALLGYELQMKDYLNLRNLMTHSTPVVYPAYEYGGIAYGPDSGYEATLHGTELVVSPKASYPATVISNGGSTQAGANNDEEVALLREQVRLLAKIATQNGQPLEITNLGKYARAQADEVIVQRTKQGRLNDGRRYNR